MNESATNIFDQISTRNTIFEDKSKIDHRFLPEHLPHRQKQITSIAKYWVEALNNVTPADITLYGKTGTGKTAVANYARKQLEEKVNINNELFIKILYIRCTDYNTEYQVIARMCQELGYEVPYRGWTKAEIVNTFRDIFRKRSLGRQLKLIVILDEIDVLLKNDGDGLLYTLTRTPNISILSISNYLDFKEFIKPRVKSSLRDREIVFPPYNAEQLEDIITERAKRTFKPNTIGSGVLQLCAAMAAKEEGDARYALDLVRTAGELADEMEQSQITIGNVEKAKERIEHSKIEDIIITLPLQPQRVLEAILNLTLEEKEITSGVLFEEYQDIAGNDAVSYRRIFDFINELELLGLISTNTVSRGRGKGRTNIIKLQCGVNLLQNIIYHV